MQEKIHCFDSARLENDNKFYGILQMQTWMTWVLWLVHTHARAHRRAHSSHQTKCVQICKIICPLLHYFVLNRLHLFRFILSYAQAHRTPFTVTKKKSTRENSNSAIKYHPQYCHRCFVSNWRWRALACARTISENGISFESNRMH